MADELDLTDFLAECTNQCIADGLELPFIVCSISQNGSILAVRIAGADSFETLAEHYEGEGFKLPITVAIVDQNNKFVRITIGTEGKVVRH